MKASIGKFTLILRIVFLANMFFVSQLSFASSLVEAKKDGVKVFAEPNKDADTITTLKKGDAVETISRKGMYWNVKAGGKTGFVSVMKVKLKKGSPSTLTSVIQKVVKQGRESDNPDSNRARSAVMGVRGLDESDETAFAGNVKPNLRMVFLMEDIVTDESKIEALGDAVFAEIEKKVK
ncbi:MAG: SH3 domain-containing protein [Bdellovibrionota bacterium]